MKPSYQRLESLDVLRGFDLFCLVALEGVLHPLGRAIDAPSCLWRACRCRSPFPDIK